MAAAETMASRARSVGPWPAGIARGAFPALLLVLLTTVPVCAANPAADSTPEAAVAPPAPIPRLELEEAAEDTSRTEPAPELDDPGEPPESSAPCPPSEEAPAPVAPFPSGAEAPPFPGTAAGVPNRTQKIATALDSGHAIQERFICSVVERVDGIFGEPYVEDRQRKVAVWIGVESTFNEDGDSTKLGLNVDGRIPLPALERRVNLFLDFGSSVEDTGEGEAVVLDESDNKFTLGATLLGRLRDDLESGLKLRIVWDDGPDYEVVPLLRYERQRDPWRTFFEQRVTWNPGDSWGLQSKFDVDRPLSPSLLLRFANRLSHTFGNRGAGIAHGFIVRQTIFKASGLSAEFWVEHNTAVNDPSTADDDSVAYLQVRWRGRIFREWLEYELRPVYSVPFVDGRDPFVSLFVSLTVVWDDYLNGQHGPPKENGH